MPVWISSRMSSTPRSRVSARSACKYSSVAGTTPASPWIGSSMTPTVRAVMAAATASRSFSGTFTKPVAFGSKSGSNAGLPEAAMVASVRPWKAPWVVTSSKAPPRRS